MKKCLLCCLYECLSRSYTLQLQRKIKLLPLHRSLYLSPSPLEANPHAFVYAEFVNFQDTGERGGVGGPEDITGGGVYLLSQPLQAIIISIILVITIVTNTTIIINISTSEIKRRTVNFVLIKHLCIVDLCGALFILPVPLVSTIKGLQRKNF